VTNNILTIRNVPPNTSPSAVVAAWQAWKAKNAPSGFHVLQAGNGSTAVAATASQDLTGPGPASLASLNNSKTQLYNQVKALLGRQGVVMPPSSAIAGVYAATDRDRGVWKAPANVSLASVLGPTVKITNDDQDNLNIDPTAGKSINAIRSFAGQGTLVWGARTLAGNDNEWRYINVRRLFNMIEDATRKASAFAVFEGNDATTWLKVKGMIESYLYGLWEQGALAGPTPDKAYYVLVGLGKTMTAQDILEGRMIVEIGIAAVRPAEFIIIRFSQMLQQA
jgi:phage tail sheath protein FI